MFLWWDNFKIWKRGFAIYREGKVIEQFSVIERTCKSNHKSISLPTEAVSTIKTPGFPATLETDETAFHKEVAPVVAGVDGRWDAPSSLQRDLSVANFDWQESEWSRFFV